MNIIVCIKQVPETGNVKINPETNTLIREGVASIINPFDMYAIEEALRLKERFSAKVTVVSMGPPQAESALREAISLGVDDAVLISDRAFAGSDTWATSYILSCAIRKLPPFDLIICGKQASDGDTAQVGPGISTHLDIPQVTYVRKIEKIEADNCVVERSTEEGFEVISSPLPALITVVKEINEPRLPSLRHMMRSKSAEIRHLTVKDLELEKDKIGLDGSPTQVVKIFSPPPRPKGAIFEGEAEDVAERLVDALKDAVLQAKSSK
ncbi:MAG: electron transfer flavoprotein subunit beta/FixA family protein [Candidatus Omnitrophica bacterium]|nr:electron transfer flavoprotein subunit beta/FixA family protein [Candidatus Omnitrophota bacterium]